MRVVIIIIIALVFSFDVVAGPQKVLVKANIMMGEQLVTAATAPKDVERIIREALIAKKYEVVESVGGGTELLYVDAFVFQFPGEFPTVTLTIRTENGVHYIDKESVKLFGDREAANLRLAEKIAKRLPGNIDTSVYYVPSIADIMSNRRINIQQEMQRDVQPYYSNIIAWPMGEVPAFISPDGFETYLSLCSNYQGIRSSVRGRPILVQLKINEKARFEIISIEAPIELNDKQKQRLKQTIQAFPLWIVDEQITGIELKLGII